jgi:hypothetical protein
MPELITLPYELLLRFDEAGELAGAHLMYRRRLLDESGAVLMDQTLDPLPLELTHPAVLAAVAALPSS